jgi:hypothetical protein
MSAFMTTEDLAGKLEWKGTKQPIHGPGVGNKKQPFAA